MGLTGAEVALGAGQNIFFQQFPGALSALGKGAVSLDPILQAAQLHGLDGQHARGGGGIGTDDVVPASIQVAADRGAKGGIDRGPAAGKDNAGEILKMVLLPGGVPLVRGALLEEHRQLHLLAQLIEEGDAIRGWYICEEKHFHRIGPSDSASSGNG